MRDLFSQCTYVRFLCVCHAQECQFALTCTLRNSCVTCTNSRGYRMRALRGGWKLVISDDVIYGLPLWPDIILYGSKVTNTFVLHGKKKTVKLSPNH